jgi:hypothetical protein
MDKRQFLEQVIERVRALDISDIIGRYIDLPKRVSGGYLGLCPFHNDTRLGSFVVTPSKGIFKCFACDAGGDGIKFVASFKNMTYIEAAFEIAKNEGVITPLEYDDFFKKRRYTKKETEQIEKVSLAKIKKANKNNIGSEELLDVVFNVFLDTLSLKKRHKEYLNKERQLDDKTIEDRKYRSAQGATDIFMSNFIDKLKESKKLKEIKKKIKVEKEEDVLEFVPGFFQKNVRGNWKWDFAYNQGIFIPIRNAENKIIGLQVRRDKKDEDRGRYFWFSSSFAAYNENFRKGTSSGSPMDVLYPNHYPSKALFITEGRFKSEAVMSKIGAVSLSIQGVSTWRNINKIIERIENKARKKYRKFDGFKNICIAFDSDMSYKYQVYRQLKKMSDSIEKNESNKKVYYIHWEGKHKGIDDLLINNSCESKKEYAKLFNTHKKRHFDLEFEKELRKILEKKGIKNAFSLSDYKLNKVASKLPQKEFRKISIQKKTS